MISKLTTAPALLVSVNDMKGYLKLDTAVDDALLTTMIKSAIEDIEIYLNRKLNPQTWTTYYEMYNKEMEHKYPDGRLELPYEPVKSITSVKNETGAVVSYRTLYTFPTSIELSYIPSESIVIVAEYGYDSGKLPDRLILAVKELTAQYYEYRCSSIPDEIKIKINSFRVIRI